MTPLQALETYFGYGQFRPHQAQAVDGFLADRDVVVLLPTGGGKSLCFQIPAIIRSQMGLGPTLVVSPLVALMRDQVEALVARGVDAVCLFRGQTALERDDARARMSKAALIYVSPERVVKPAFLRKLARLNVSAVAVDEAHCVSEWGHDFRPEYRQLGVLQETFGVPTMALTATATPRVADDIVAALELSSPMVLKGSVHRPNLAFSVFHTRGEAMRMERLLHHLQGMQDQRVIVYAGTRKRTVSTAKALKKKGFRSDYYHAGRTERIRNRVQSSFRAGKVKALVATTAFGMGIDLPDVRMVAHINAPGTLESYVQQAGRAGRDGHPARCLLLHGPSDARLAATLSGSTPGARRGWKALTDYSFGQVCRQVAIAEHFGELLAPCGACDVCVDPVGVGARLDVAREGYDKAKAVTEKRKQRDQAASLSVEQLELVVRFVNGLKRPLGRTTVAAGLRGSKAKRLSRYKLQQNELFGVMRGVPEPAILRGIDTLLDEGMLATKGRKYPTLWIPEKPVRPKGRTRKPRVPDAPLVAALKALRTKECRRRRVKPYQIFPDKTIAAIAKREPASVAQLLDIPGMGPKRIGRYSEAILTLVIRHGSSRLTAVQPSVVPPVATREGAATSDGESVKTPGAGADSSPLGDVAIEPNPDDGTPSTDPVGQMSLFGD